MKPKKALKRLSRVEAILSAVREQYTTTEEGVLESLDSAKASIAHAWESVSRAVATSLAKKKVAVKAKKAKVKTKAKAKPQSAKTKRAKTKRAVTKSAAPPRVVVRVKRKAPAAAKKRAVRKPPASTPKPEPQPAELGAAGGGL